MACLALALLALALALALATPAQAEASGNAGPRAAGGHSSEGADANAMVSERLALLEKRVFELEMQLKQAKGSSEKKSWWFQLGGGKSGGKAPKHDDPQPENSNKQPLQAFSHLSRGRVAHILASGQKKWHHFMDLKAAVMTQGDVSQVCNVPGKRSG